MNHEIKEYARQQLQGQRMYHDIIVLAAPKQLLHKTNNKNMSANQSTEQKCDNFSLIKNIVTNSKTSTTEALITATAKYQNPATK